MVISVLDYSSGSLWVFKIPKETDDIEIYLSNLGYNLDNCYWMITNYVNLDYDFEECNNYCK